MNVVDRKLLRDLVHLRGQMIAVALVVMCGVATFVTMVSVYQSLLATRAAYYDRYRFADLFTQVKRAPESAARQIGAITGVAAVQSRIVMEVTLDVPGLDEPAIGRLISIPDRKVPILNDLHIRSGRYPEAGRPNEVLASEAFAQANDLGPGDSLGAVINGRWRRLRIVGVALSPEYVYEFSGRSLFPDNKRFGVLWMGRDALSAAFDMNGAFNDLAIRLVAGVRERDVIDRADHILAPYGSLGAYGRGDQMSDRFLSEELAQLRANATIVPVIFLGVAAFLLHIVLSRLVGTQRDQIAVLKAFGYSNTAVGLHFMKFALVAVFAGAIAGTGLGAWLGAGLTELYTKFYRFPILRYAAGWDVVAWAVVISGGAAIVGALGAVRRAVALPPAEAMRPEAPPRFRRGVVARLGLERIVSPTMRMVIRNLERSPAKAMISVLGIALSVSILVIGYFSFDAINFINDLQFRIIEREDITLTFVAQRPPGVMYNLAHLPGVIGVEPFRTVPARLRHRNHVRLLAVQGLNSDAQLRRVISGDGLPYSLPPSGLVLTSKLAEVLDVAIGDSVQVEILEGERPVRAMRVAGVVEELVGLSAYIERTALNRLMREGPVVSGAYLAVDAAYREQLYRQLKRTPAVAGVAVRRAMLESFEKTIGESQGMSRSALVAFASVIAFGIVYNSARIALSERGRELASLRVLGFRKAEVAWILFAEQALLTLLAIPTGFGLGYLFAGGVALAMSGETYRIPLVISSSTYAFAAMVVAIASAFSALLVRRRLYTLDIVEVLKTRE